MTVDPQLAQFFLKRARRDLLERYRPQVRECVCSLTEEQIWWRPNEASNSIGNLVLHITGQIGQWLLASFNRTEFTRNRAQEFAERGPIPISTLLVRFDSTIEEAGVVLARLTPEELAGSHVIFGKTVSGLEAVFHSVSHFALHYGQIAYITKWLTGRDLGFRL